MLELTVIYDANVLYPNFLRDLLMRLAMCGLFRARWTEEIHREWMAAVRRERPDIPQEKVERTRLLMDSHALEPLVSGYEELIEDLELPDGDDRHVLAAAIQAGAQFIVTNNLKDFPERNLRPYGVQAIAPDPFVLRLLDAEQARVVSIFELHRDALKAPPFSLADYCLAMEKQRMPRSAQRLRVIWGLVLQS